MLSPSRKKPSADESDAADDDDILLSCLAAELPSAEEVDDVNEPA